MIAKSCILQHKSIGEVEVPRLMLGTSPFIGAGQFGSRSMKYHLRFARDPKNVKELIVEAAKIGITWVQVLGYEFLVNAVEDARNITKMDIQVIGSIGESDFHRQFGLMKRLDTKIILTHGIVTDRLDNRFEDYIYRINEVAIAGAVTHHPGKTVSSLSDYDKVKIIMVPINKKGKFMSPSPQKSLEAIRNTDKVLIGKKTLAAGDLKPKEALEYVADFVYGVTIGIASSEELKETFTIAKEIWNTNE
ncbi:MAG: hypothetical protein SWO11_14115 [Thermodesulfobacteriota bacterium]|nr:hypothetical protein [Thermodesulfobacteriota bacterium]